MKNTNKILALILVLLAQGAFSQGIFYFGPAATVIVNDSVVIRLNDYKGTIQWQKSSDLQLWDNIPGATQDSVLFVADTTTYFRAEVIVGFCEPFYSDTTLIQVVKTGVNDIDGNFYASVIIGNQEWMAENLKTTRYRNGTSIEYPGTDNTARESNTTGAYAWYQNDIAWKHSYGALYNWHAVNNSNGLCPTGWHIPSDGEWTELVNYVTAQGYPNRNVVNGAGNALKSCRQVSSPLGGDCAISEHPRWDSQSSHHGTDEFGFSALPGGFGGIHFGAYYMLGNYGSWWTSSEHFYSDAYSRSLYLSAGYVNRNGYSKGLGKSVRCVRDAENDDSTTFTLTLHISPFGHVSGTGNYPEGATVAITGTPHINHQFVDWTGDTEHIADASAASTTLTMPAQNITLTANFEQDGGGNIQPGEGITDIDGNYYPSVIIGKQEWMAANLRVTQYNNSDAIPNELNISESGNTPHGSYNFYNNHDDMLEAYGALYNWYAVDDVRGLCPTGWHVPSDAEWTELGDYVLAHIVLPSEKGNALKSCRQVLSPLGGDCATLVHPRWNSHSIHSGTDEFGFSALPGGCLYTSDYYGVGIDGYWWTSTEKSSTSAWLRHMFVDFEFLDRSSFEKVSGYSVRCVRDN